MINHLINILKLKKKVDHNSIEMFHACLEYNSKSQPIINQELEKWPEYLAFWNTLMTKNNVTPFVIKTTIDNIKLSGDFIKTPIKNDNNNKIVFLLHGITNTRYWIFKQAYVFLNAGFNVVWYDARNHGQSDNTMTTFGKKEAEDLQDVINYISDNYHSYHDYILYGFSLGAASILMWGEIHNNYKNNKKVKLLICDSAFSRLDQTYNEKVGNYTFLPTNIMNNFFRNQVKKNLGSESLELLHPIKYLKYLQNMPTLFIHGKNDSFISYTNAEELYQEKIRYEQPIKSQLYLVNYANHGQSFLVGDVKPEIFNEYNQSFHEKISDLVLNYIKINME